MVTTSSPHLGVQRTEPLVWASRLLILDSVDPWRIIRDVPLHRGLNIVWSVDVDRNDEAAPVMTGHGVGKTTFCRLLRFCLGEKSFGRKSLAQRIHAEMPNAIVGAEIHVAGETWAVARPLGRSHFSYAKRGVTIEELLTDRPPSRSYHEFTDELAQSALDGFPPDVMLTGSRPILWDHVLAWCARDQEARYQNFWDWRSTRSDSDTPSFIRHREDPMYLVRAALGLVATAEIQLQRRLVEIERRLKELETQTADRLQEPQFQVRRLRRTLVEEFDIVEAADAPLTPGELFTLPALVKQRQSSITAEIDNLDTQLTDVNRKLLALQSSIQDAEQMAEEWTAATDTTQSGSETVASATERHHDDRKRLDEISNEWCRYGGVTFGECQHVKDRGSRLDELIQVEGTKTTTQVARRDQVSAEMRERAERMVTRKQELITARETLLTTKQELETQRTILDQKGKALPRAFKSLTDWNEIVAGNTEDSTLTYLRIETETLESEQQTKTSELATALAAQGQRLGNLQRVFGGLVADVLNPEFQGTVRIHDGEIECNITHGSVLAGEAVETLSVLLTDLACLFLGTENNCRHPGLHIHDSPREADLGARIYRRFLECIGTIHTTLGGRESAPFQYIVTTTTAPPSALQSDEHVCLRLSNEREEDLMLGRTLGALPEPDVETLFPID